MSARRQEQLISGPEPSLNRVVWWLCGFAIIGAIALLFLHPSARQSLRDGIDRVLSGIQSLLISPQSKHPAPDSVAGNAPHVVRTVPITPAPATGSAVVSPAATPQAESPRPDGSAVIPHVVHTVPIVPVDGPAVIPHAVHTVPVIPSPPSASSPETNKIPTAPPSNSFAPSAPLPAQP